VDVAWANMQYLAFANPEEPNLDALDELLATMCRPARNDLHEFQQSKDWDGDIREPYNGQRVKARARNLKALISVSKSLYSNISNLKTPCF
jgi:hypothetical protein